MSKAINILKQASGITIFLIFLMLLSISAKAVSISGKVINSDTKETLPGVSVFVKNTVLGTSSDINGDFQLKNIPTDSVTVVFSFVGFKMQELNFSNNNLDSIIIELQPSSISLQEVVISTAKNQLKSFEQTTPVSVLTQSKITENATQDLADIISREPG
ncbi:MAG: carboxypeptidase-like regulatory domain-containing protein, partial [Bacteroidota bacterium]|nr:carboxypeptidase-like regulatory domain-containing protein [Bacteroidota bacterium]